MPRSRLIPFLLSFALASTALVSTASAAVPIPKPPAIDAAETNPGPDVVQFAKQLQGTITLTNGELAITTDLTIDGPGANRITVSGNDSSRIFNVLGGADARETCNSWREPRAHVRDAGFR